ncbi:MAG: glycosyltransferase family 4 protein [Actinobacteria bacterium]|nr:MAG: glycosyltransferase family 4 protein [Actinomycetota bacterium]
MRIAYLHQYFNTPDMSGGTRSYEVARRFAELGHEVHMVTTDRSGEAGSGWRETREAGFTAHWTPVPYSNRMNYAERVRAFFAFATRAGRRAASLRPDVVFATSTPLTIALPAVRAAKRRRVPMVLEIRDVWPRVPVALGALHNPIARAAAERLERYAYRHADRIVAFAPGMRQWVVSQGYPAERAVVIPNGCDLRSFPADPARAQAVRDTREWLDDRPMALFAGTLGAVNGAGWLADVAAAAKAIDPGALFVVMGDGRERDAIEAHARALGVLGDTFHLLRARPKAEMPAWLTAATVSVSMLTGPECVYEDVGSNKIFDTMACGKPLVTNHTGWLADLLACEGAGIVLDPGDVAGAAAAICRCMRDAEWLASAGAAARHLAEERFDRDELAGQLERVLLDAVEEARR